MKSLLLTLGSLALSVGVVMNAYYQKKQFYPSVVYITKSSPSMAVLYLQAFVIVILMGKVMRKIFFGQLRAAELEHLIERSWYAVTETCLAFTVFRDDFSPRFVALFTVLLFLKCFHWLAEDRIDYMERSPMISFIFHIRAISLLSLLAFLDSYFVNHAYHNTLIKGPSVQLVFGFEYAILFTVVIHVFVKYVLHAIDLHNENPWESKAVYLLYTELILGFFKVLLYLIFLAIMIKVHTFPLFVIRPMYLTIREFKKAFNDAIMSRRAIRNMNTLYPDATPEELASGDNVCIICREEMHVSCKKLPCNHIFHSSCLRSWFQRQQTCPTCRMDVFRTQQRPQNQQPPQPAPPPAGLQMPQGPFPLWPPNFIPPMPPHLQQPAGQNANVGQAPGSTAPVPGVAPTITAPVGAAPTASVPIRGGLDGAGFLNAPAPFMMPPFCMPLGFPPPPPPPAIPSSFVGLTDEQLRMMEGDERANIEARIVCLQDIQTLLNAAMLQIQQYMSVTATSFNRAPQHHPFAFSPTAAAAQADATASAPQSATDKQLPKVDVARSSSLANGSFSKTASTDDTEKFDSELEGAVGFTPPQDELLADWTEATDADLEDRNELREIRRRRLEHLSDSNKSSPSSS